MSAQTTSSLTRHAVVAATALTLLWAVFRTYAANQPMWAVGLLALGAAALTIYASAGKNVAWKYLFPGVAGMLLFAAFPLLYTVQIGFTNYSSGHLLTEDRARAYLLDQREVDEAGAYDFTLLRDGKGGHRLTLTPADGRDGPALSTAVLDLNTITAESAAVTATLADTSPASGTPVDLRERIALRPALQALRIQTPGGAVLGYAGLREYAPVRPLWQAQPDGSLKHTADGSVARPNRDTGFFETAPGQTLTPGFKVNIGFAHYTRMLTDADFRGPFVAIFGWTVTFSALTVLFSTALGLGLAVALNWEGLKHRTLYRTLLFLPYAVPGFISILVFKGLFNQNFGEINAILDGLFGIRPAWFADPLLAKAMILIVNTWLGYPYIMVLATGLIKAIPADLYEASAIAGAGPWTNFRRITAPLIIKPLMPLLISAFAFNFNNFVLISLLTDGRPDYLNTKLPAGTTDILVSYTYRIAFTDAGQNFGLAAAISTLIFGMVALMALLQLRFMRGADANHNAKAPKR
ncbi:maltose ABC transporter permease MalF [Ideonella sp. DXS22W]|uniref:Maltose/maltodextrin transport system permease protein n=1 Tax=Pseudaquabacterium inlustre TaxID=2984192 RepID=A0ABU9CGA2_9BURK